MRSVWLWPILALTVLTACSPVGPPATVPGPEAADLAARTNGVVLLPEHPGGIVAIALPTGKRTTVVPPARFGREECGTTHALCGPDSLGRLAVINDFSLSERHEVNIWTLGGKHLRTLISRRGQALWHNTIGESMALSPAGGQLAILSKLADPAETNPFATPRGYELEVWDIDQGTGRKTGIVAQDHGLAWLPAGNKLLYTAYAPRRQLSTLPLAGGDGFGQSFGTALEVPVVCLLDLKSMATRRVHVGQGPVPAPDGNSAVVTDYEGHSRRVDLAGGRSTPVKVPGQWSALMAILPGDLAIYPGLPTAGTKPGLTRNNSPLVGAKYMRTIKVAELATGRFQTVVEAIDPRDRPTFGRPAALP